MTVPCKDCGERHHPNERCPEFDPGRGALTGPLLTLAFILGTCLLIFFTHTCHP